MVERGIHIDLPLKRDTLYDAVIALKHVSTIDNDDIYTEIFVLIFVLPDPANGNVKPSHDINAK